MGDSTCAAAVGQESGLMAWLHKDMPRFDMELRQVGATFTMSDTATPYWRGVDTAVILIFVAGFIGVLFWSVMYLMVVMHCGRVLCLPAKPPRPGTTAMKRCRVAVGLLGLVMVCIVGALWPTQATVSEGLDDVSAAVAEVSGTVQQVVTLSKGMLLAGVTANDTANVLLKQPIVNLFPSFHEEALHAQAELHDVLHKLGSVYSAIEGIPGYMNEGNRTLSDAKTSVSAVVTGFVVVVSVWTLLLLVSLVQKTRCRRFRRGILVSALAMLLAVSALTAGLVGFSMVQADFCASPVQSAMTLLPTTEGWAHWNFGSSEVAARATARAPRATLDVGGDGDQWRWSSGVDAQYQEGAEALAAANGGHGRRLKHMSEDTVQLIQATAHYYLTCNPAVRGTNASNSGGPHSALTRVEGPYAKLQALYPILQELQFAAKVFGSSNPVLIKAMNNLTRSYHTFNTSVFTVLQLMQCGALHDDYQRAVDGVCCPLFQGVSTAALCFGAISLLLLAVLGCGLWLWGRVALRTVDSHAELALKAKAMGDEEEGGLRSLLASYRRVDPPGLAGLATRAKRRMALAWWRALTSVERCLDRRAGHDGDGEEPEYKSGDLSSTTAAQEWSQHTLLGSAKSASHTWMTSDGGGSVSGDSAMSSVMASPLRHHPSHGLANSPHNAQWGDAKRSPGTERGGHGLAGMADDGWTHGGTPREQQHEGGYRAAATRRARSGSTGYGAYGGDVAVPPPIVAGAGLGYLAPDSNGTVPQPTTDAHASQSELDAALATLAHAKSTPRARQPPAPVRRPRVSMIPDAVLKRERVRVLAASLAGRRLERRPRSRSEDSEQLQVPGPEQPLLASQVASPGAARPPALSDGRVTLRPRARSDGSANVLQCGDQVFDAASASSGSLGCDSAAADANPAREASPLPAPVFGVVSWHRSSRAMRDKRRARRKLRVWTDVHDGEVRQPLLLPPSSGHSSVRPARARLESGTGVVSRPPQYVAPTIPPNAATVVSYGSAGSVVAPEAVDAVHHSIAPRGQG